MGNNQKLDNLINAEQAKLAKLEEKYAQIGQKIKACKSNIDRYTMMKNAQQLSTIANSLDDKGISIEEVLAAIQAGDLLSLQEKMDVNLSQQTSTEE